MSSVDSKLKTLHCTSCGKHISQLYTTLSTGSIHLYVCPFCDQIADKYIEYDLVVVFCDLLLFRPAALIHLLYNRHAYINTDEKPSTKNTVNDGGMCSGLKNGGLLTFVCGPDPHNSFTQRLLLTALPFIILAYVVLALLRYDSSYLDYYREYSSSMPISVFTYLTYTSHLASPHNTLELTQHTHHGDFPPMKTAHSLDDFVATLPSPSNVHTRCLYDLLIRSTQTQTTQTTHTTHISHRHGGGRVPWFVLGRPYSVSLPSPSPHLNSHSPISSISPYAPPCISPHSTLHVGTMVVVELVSWFVYWAIIIDLSPPLLAAVTGSAWVTQPSILRALLLTSYPLLFTAVSAVWTVDSTYINAILLFVATSNLFGVAMVVRLHLINSKTQTTPLAEPLNLVSDLSRPYERSNMFTLCVCVLAVGAHATVLYSSRHIHILFADLFTAVVTLLCEMDVLNAFDVFVAQYTYPVLPLTPSVTQLL